MTNADDLPPRGHNLPPDGLLPLLPIADPAPERIKEARAAIAPDLETLLDPQALAAFQARVAQFCDAAGAWADIKTINSAPQSERLTDFVTGARQLFKLVDEARKEAKKPHDDRAAAVQKAFAPLLDKLTRVAESMKAMQADWLKREKDRIEAERRAAAEAAEAKRLEAERLAAEAAARSDISGQVDAEAAARAAETELRAASKEVKARAGSATGGGRTMALRTHRSARITNLRAAFAYFQTDQGVIDAITRAANQAIRDGMTDDEATLAGIEIVTKESAA